MKKSLIVAILLLSFPAGALAEISIAYSVELTVAGSDVVVRARFVGRTDIDAWPRGWPVSSYRVEEVLLGGAGETLEVLGRDRRDEDDAEGAESLLFLRRHCLRFREPILAAAADRVPFRLREQVRLDVPVEQFTMACETITDRSGPHPRPRRVRESRAGDRCEGTAVAPGAGRRDRFEDEEDVQAGQVQARTTRLEGQEEGRALQGTKVPPAEEGEEVGAPSVG